MADLVDNSIDAGARRALIRFVRREDRLVGLYVVDDGCGMTDEMIDRAMTVGGNREYASNDLGHFGFGLKAASLGQAESLTVVSRAAGHAACGRRWLSHKASTSFECDVLSGHYAGQLLDANWMPLPLRSGTVVRWDGVRAFPRSRRAETTNRFLEETLVRLRQHLGLVFHRFIAAEAIELVLDVEDLDVGETSAPLPVEAIDPFGYLKTGAAGYPRELTVRMPGGDVELQLHIWTPRSQLIGFRLGHARPAESQGFYFYRNHRLLQAGGWNGVVHPDRKYQLARVCVDVNDGLVDQVTMNPEKTSVRVSRDFVHAVEHAASEGVTFADYLDHSSSTFQQSQRRTRSRPRVVPPGRGFAPAVRKAISSELDFIAGEDPIDIRWADFVDDSFFDIDREGRAIWLNKQYRWAVLGDKDSSLNDAPLIKAMLFLLLEDLFRGTYLGSKDKDNVQLWGSILAAAARAEAQ